MPIKKQNLERYPPNFRKISWWIINIRAENRCEGILENGERCGAENHQPHPVTGKKVVLSVAHLDHTPEHSDQDLPPDAPLEQSNMRAFCQRCHNRWDREHRNESIKQTYKEKHGEIPEQIQEELKGLVVFKKAVDKSFGGFLTKIKSQVDKELNSKIEWATTTPESYDAEPTSNILLDEVGQWEEPREEQTIDALQETLQRLIKLLPAKSAIDHTILSKSLELQEEYMKLISLSNKEIATPQVQAQLTTMRSQMSVIEQLKSLRKTIKAAAGNLRNEPVAVQAEEVEEEELPESFNVRGMGIRHIINKRKKI